MAFAFVTNFLNNRTARDNAGDKDTNVTHPGLGRSGTELYAGQFTEEYLSKLVQDRGIAIYDEMRRSDGQVKMLLSVVKNPIKSASWSFVAVDESEEEKEIAEFAKHVLFEDIVTKSGKRKTFSEFLTEAMTFVEYGFSVFEIVHKNVKGDKKFGDYLGIADLGFRHQRSIKEWVLRPDGSINFVRQLVNGDLGVDVDIPGQFILVFSNDKEGDNYEGISMLRPCYGSWFRKNIYRKLQAIGIERASKGVPIGKIPMEMINRSDYQAQLTAFQALIDKLSAHEKNGIAMGAGFDISELKLSHDAEKVQAVISSENVEMSKAFMANFMELGLERNGGSYSLGSDLSDIFLSGIEFHAYMICEKLNLQVIEPLIRAKYGERDAYPKLTVKGINDKAGKEFADAIAILLRDGGLQKSPRLQKHLHEVYNLPDIDQDIADAQQEAILNPPAPPSNTPPTEKTPDQKKTVAHECTGCGHVKLSEEQRKEFPVAAYIEDRASALETIMRASLKSRSDEMLTAMVSVIRAGDDNTRRDVLRIGMAESKDYVAQIVAWASDTVQGALDGTLEELGLKKRGFKFADDLKKLPKDARDRIVQAALLIAGYQEDDIEKAVYFAFNENFTVDADADMVIAKMQKASDDYFEKQNIFTASVNASSNVVNNTRDEVFRSEDVFAEIESFVFMNASPETEICKSLVGRVFSKEEYETTPFLPPLHHNCDSYIVAQTLGAEGNKSLTPGGLTVTDPKLLKQATL